MNKSLHPAQEDDLLIADEKHCVADCMTENNDSPGQSSKENIFFHHDSSDTINIAYNSNKNVNIEQIIQEFHKDNAVDQSHCGVCNFARLFFCSR